ncbi:glycoside hydrolase family 38 C-terminal domain-containing protein [Vagococcus intermedius]|uniref:Alpha-mannosidase n=1 Tax=Vagococcus intermedius TaxID=2991418 RepID=A0AAF0I5B8_9ENTE|nr:glycoside hydrolase family 38 C-terminal domain-containing protein [Vagococcus intermedius]WEG72883.1 alpha-mannosidase [Vagococcus intermedius]WEG74970.1 alpha-mannosidase [Vagococcus intermedius]
MKNVYTVAHTHWDYEWYFTRQESKAQFIFHMDEVLTALEEKKLDYYTLDGQMSILEDYLSVCPEKEASIRKFVKAGRLFIGPWFTQIDEMTTSGESIVRNLRLGMKQADELGGTMRVGYLPDSFGQSQDMPKIYQGFNINHALFWRGLAKDAKTRYFYWSSEDGSKVLTANIKNGYYAGVDLIENNQFDELVERISTETPSCHHLLPTGGDQRAVDFNLKERIELGNQESDESINYIESNYPEFFKALETQKGLPELTGEFIDPSDSKIHRGIYSSRYDLKQLYDKLERVLTYQLEPFSIIARDYGISVKQGLIDSLWATVARGQAHDSAGGCNSDKTNQDIYQRGINALQEAQSTMDYLLRKVSISINENQLNELFIWNPLPFDMSEVRQFEVTTQLPEFKLVDKSGKELEFDIVTQRVENDALLRRNPAERLDESYYVTTVAIKVDIPAMSYIMVQVSEGRTSGKSLKVSDEISSDAYRLQFKEGKFNLYSEKLGKWYTNFLKIEDGGDEGDTYDYSPAYHDWLLELDFSNATETIIEEGNLVSRMLVKGEWQLPYNLDSRKNQRLDAVVGYELELILCSDSPRIDVNLTLDNQVLDHRMRLMLMTDIKGTDSYADTPFGVIKRPVEDDNIKNWREIGYKEEPTSMRPMLHFANTHSNESSWSFLTKGTKDFQLIGDDYETLAITIFRGVGFLGRPDTIRRPGDASGLHMRELETPDSQLLGKLTFEGSIILDSKFDAQDLQKKYLSITQENLYYQTQVLNRFTTQLQYFQSNLLPLEKTIVNQKLAINNENVVISSLLPSIDGTGIELRLYNPSKEKISQVGTIDFESPVDVFLLDLEGKIKQSLSANIDKLEMKSFEPGEIRTYGIHFK